MRDEETKEEVDMMISPGRLAKEVCIRWAGALCLLGSVVLSVLLTTTPAGAQTAGPIKIGVLHDLTGPLSVMGKDFNEGLKLYMSEINYQIAGRKIELIYEDPESKVDPGITKMRKLVERDKVNLILGPINTALAYAMRDYVDKNKIPTVLTMATATDLTQAKSSAYVFRTSFGSEQLNVVAGWYAQKKLGYKRAILIGLDYTGGREQAGGFVKGFTQAGGTVVGEVYAPLGTADWAPYLTKVKADLDKADFVAIILWGPDAMRVIRGITEYGLKGLKPVFAHGNAVDEALLPSEGDAALGILNFWTYSPTANTPENQRFKELFRKQYAKQPGSYHEMTYLAAKVVGEAIRKVSGKIEDTPRFLAELRKIRIEAPQGSFRFDDKQNAIIDLHIRKVEKVNGELVNTYLERVPGIGQDWTPPR